MFKTIEAADFPVCYDIWQRAQGRSSGPIGADWSKKDFQKACKNNSSIAYYDSEQLIAFLFYVDLNGEIEILQLACDPNFWGKGFVNELFAEFESSIKCEKIFLEVHSDNKHGLDFYRRQGFNQVGCRDAYYSDGGDAILMGKEFSK